MQIPWMMLVNKDVSEDLVYDMTKAIAENKEALTASFAAFGRADFSKMAPNIGVEYHPGAVRYFKEAGIPTPE
jgi:TRAP-type uncharacterized transport system substrate-binding protein